jgi:hypothetical protein
MLSTINQAFTNQGVLGAHCNALMLCKGIYGRLPEKLPATLEDVIDGSVKTHRHEAKGEKILKGMVIFYDLPQPRGLSCPEQIIHKERRN